MFSLHVLLEIARGRSSKVAQVTRMHNTLMFKSNMVQQMTFISSLIITLTARVPHSLVQRQCVFLQTALSCRFERTLVTMVENLLVLSINVHLQVFSSRGLVVTSITRIFDSLMHRLDVNSKVSLLTCLVVTLITEVLNALMNSLNMRLQYAIRF